MTTTEIEQVLYMSGPTKDALLAAGDALQRLAEFQRELKAQWETKMQEFIQANGPIVCGDVKYYVGTKKTTKCVDVPGAVEALLTKVEGDFSRFCDHLSSGAVKYGAARDTLDPADYERLFLTTEETELKEGKATPTKRLQKVNEKFLTR